MLDADRRVAPVGVPGELYLGGQCLARGYWGRPVLTADRFVPHPLAAGRPRVPHRRPGTVRRGRCGGVPRPARRPGEDPRLPHRARRGRGGARPASTRGPGGRRGGGVLARRQAARWLRRRARRQPRRRHGRRTRRPGRQPLGRAARVPAGTAAGLDGAVDVRSRRGAARDAERQGGPPGADRARRGSAVAATGPPRNLRHAGGGGAGRDLARRPPRPLGQPWRQLLRARRSLTARHAARLADPPGPQRGAAAAHGVRGPGAGGPCPRGGAGRAPDRGRPHLTPAERRSDACLVLAAAALAARAGQRDDRVPHLDRDPVPGRRRRRARSAQPQRAHPAPRRAAHDLHGPRRGPDAGRRPDARGGCARRRPADVARR